MKKVLMGLGSVLMVWLILVCATTPTMAQPAEKGEIDIEELVEFLREYDTPQLERLKQLEERNPEQFEKLLEKSYHEMLRLKELRQDEPEQFEKIMAKRRKQTMREGREGKKKEKRPGQRQRKQEARERQEKTDINPDKIIKFLKKINPGWAERLQHLQKENPKEFREHLRGAYRHMLELQELKEHNPEQFEVIVKQNRLEFESHKLAEKYKQTDNEQEKEGIKKELRETLSEIFAMREQERMHQVEKLEEELRRLKEKMERRKEIRDQIIEERFKRLTGEKEEWEW